MMRRFSWLAVLLVSLAASSVQAQTSRSASSISYYNRGNVWYAKGELARAIADYDLAIAVDPKNAKFYYNRGLCRYDQRDLSGAIAGFTRAIALNPAFADAYYNRGAAQLVNGVLDIAITDFDHAIKLNRRLASAYLSRGIARLLKGDEVQAEKDLEEFRRLGGTAKPRLEQVIDEARRLNRPLVR
jgi:tetratricopeptide (TPR) repeat protein